MFGASTAKYNVDSQVLIWGTNPYQPDFTNSQATITVAFENTNFANFYMYYVNGQYAGHGSGKIYYTFIVPVVCNGSDPTLTFNLRVVNSNYPNTGSVTVSISSISGGTIESGYGSFVTNYTW